MEMFKLELVRPGPLYGQLLSKLTNYLALCDGVEADTFRLPFDHYEIEQDLQALRYYVGDDAQSRVPNTLRAAALERLSNRLGDTLGQMRSFQTRFAQTAGTDLTHLRLLLNGSELSLVPFELSSVPQGWRSAGTKLFLQSRDPVVVTRELRHSNRYTVEWNRRPRILFCTASPQGYAAPPAQAHLVAIAQALRPWLEGGKEQGRALELSDVVTVLEDASLDSIDRATRLHEYTHVHMLCHGCPLPRTQGRYGIALAQKSDPNALEVVDATALARALWSGVPGRKPPTLVVLASCDSANQSSVISPGSSVAHDLHHEGIPWVIASQMPLTYRGSATLARTLYEGLFTGQDPRWVLNHVRAELARDPESHDWASLVAYAAFPNDFDRQVQAFAVKQLRRLIEAAFGRAGDDAKRQAEEFGRIAHYVAQWERLTPKQGWRSAERSELLGMKGAICKQKAALKQGDEAQLLLTEAARHYRDAATAQLENHWVTVQFLSLRALLARDELDQGWIALAERCAELDYEQSESGRAWAAASLLELALLRADGKALNRSYAQWAEDLAKLVTNAEDFVYFSTERQLRRYFDGQFRDRASEVLRERAKQALELLTRHVLAQGH